jgi:hypothetical protein
MDEPLTAVLVAVRVKVALFSPLGIVTLVGRVLKAVVTPE